MLKISRLKTDRHAVTLKLEGSIVAPWTAELLQACESVLGEQCPLALDLAEVTFLDNEAAKTLQHLHRRGVDLNNSSSFIKEQLKLN